MFFALARRRPTKRAIRTKYGWLFFGASSLENSGRTVKSPAVHKNERFPILCRKPFPLGAEVGATPARNAHTDHSGKTVVRWEKRDLAARHGRAIGPGTKS